MKNLEKNDNSYRYYLEDMICILRQKGESIKEDFLNKDKDEFLSGQLFAYYEILDLIKSQAIAFGLDLRKIKLDELEPEDFLVNK